MVQLIVRGMGSTIVKALTKVLRCIKSVSCQIHSRHKEILPRFSTIPKRRAYLNLRLQETFLEMKLAIHSAQVNIIAVNLINNLLSVFSMCCF